LASPPPFPPPPNDWFWDVPRLASRSIEQRRSDARFPASSRRGSL